MSASAAEAELAIERLLSKMDAWVMQQPEVLLIWTQPRNVRRRVAQLLADALVTIPTRDSTGTPNRAQRRAIIEEMKRANPEWWKDAASFLGGAR